MTKDYSELFSLGAAGMPKPRTLSLLDKLGWQGFFAAQIDADELAQTPPVRVTEVHRSGLQVIGQDIDQMIPPNSDMRELQLTDTSSGIEDVFADITELAATCRFSDCLHETEPDCAVIMAIDGGQLDPSRLARWRKLAAEDRFNSASLVERRAADKAFGKKVRAIVKGKRK